LSTRSKSSLLALCSVLLAAGCSKQSADTSVGLDPGCPSPAGVALTQSQVAAAISGIKSLFSGKLSFDVDPAVVQMLTDSRRAGLIVASLMCAAEKRGDITSTDASRVEYTRKLFLYTWGTSPAPGPEDVQAWTVSHPYSHVTPDPAPSATSPSFASEHFDAIDPNADVCTQHVIPAGVPVCVRLPAESTVGIYAAEAHDHGILLTSVHTVQSASWIKQNIDYAICVRLTPEAHGGDTSRGPIALEVDSLSRDKCVVADGSGTPAAAK
jgi:hypothetical protein